MPITYSISDRESLVSIRAFGTLTTRELMDLIEGVSADHEFLPGMSVLVDCTEVTSVTLVSGLREAALEVGKLTKGKQNKIAIAAFNGFVYGLSRQFASYAELFGVEAGVFRSVEEACSWLNISGGKQSDLIDLTSHEEHCFIQ